MPKMDTVLKEAIAACQTRYGDDRWLCLDPGEQTEAIYREMRRIDLEHTQALCQSPPPDQTGEAVNEDVQSTQDIRLLRTRARKPDPQKCSAMIKTRSSDRCSWRATVTRNGLPYCGFHDPERRDAGRRDQGSDTTDVSRQVGRLRLELMR